MKKFVFLCLFLVHSLLAPAAVILVGSNSDLPTMQGGLHTLRSAIAAANPNDSIQFSANFTITFGSPIIINKSLSIIGNGTQATILDGNGSARLFEVYQPVNFQGLTFQNARSLSSGSSNAGWGGAVHLNTNASFLYCDFKNNEGSVGGAVHITLLPTTPTNGNILFNQCHFSTNHANFGGGLHIGNTSSKSLIIQNTTFDGNYSQTYGGAFQTDYGNVVMQNCKLLNNSTGFAGGGIYMAYSTVECMNVAVVNNQANDGAGVYLDLSSTLQLRSTTIAGNQANTGGGVSGENSQVNAYNTIIAQNQASSSPDIESNSGLAWVVNLIGGNFIGNTAGVSSSTGWDLMGSSTFVLDPRFANLSNGNAALSPCSPALNIGINAAIPQDIYDVDGDLNTAESIDIDVNGMPRRYQQGIVDAGAYEYQGLPNSFGISINEERDAFYRQVIALVAQVSNGSGNYAYEWKLNGQVLSTDQRLLNPCTRKNYVLTVTDLVCNTVQTITYSFRNLYNECGEDPADPVFGLKVYPNPSNGIFTIAVPEGEIRVYTIVNTYGEVIENKVVKKLTNQLEINLGQQRAGLYLLKLVDRKGNTYQKRVFIGTDYQK
ncbi:MAG: T9SS type A sorting domain-containing protein [Flammeovirgaceae bacterium]